MGNVRKITRQGAAKMACSILAQYEVVKREYGVIDCRIKFGLGTDSDRALVLEHSYRLHSLVRDAARYISDVFGVNVRKLWNGLRTILLILSLILYLWHIRNLTAISAIGANYAK